MAMKMWAPLVGFALFGSIGAAAQFGPPVVTPTSGAAAPFGLAVADFDGDGVVEAACAETGPDRIEWFENDGTGTLTSAGTALPPAGGSSHFRMIAVDVDNDGDVDLVAASTGAFGPGGDGLSIFLNTSPLGGPVAFAAAAFVPTANADPSALTAADFNGDGFMDVAAANWSFFAPPMDPNVSVHFNTATGASPYFGPGTAIAYPGGAHVPMGIASADLDGDGDVDLAVCGRDPAPAALPDGVAIFANVGGGVFALAPGSPVAPNGGFGYPAAVGIRNFDGGAADLAILVEADPPAGTFFMDALSNGGGLTFAPFAGGAFGPGDFSPSVTNSLDVFDVDQDGNADVLFARTIGGALRFFLSNGAGGFPATGTVAGPGAGPFFTELRHGDMDGDGVPDAVVANDDGAAPSVVVYLNAAAPVAAPLTIATGCPLPGAKVGSPYTLPLSATGGVPPYSWAVMGGLPPGFSFQSSTGTLTGTPAAAGTFSLFFILTDADGVVRVKGCTLTVTSSGKGGSHSSCFFRILFGSERPAAGPSALWLALVVATLLIRLCR